MQLKHNYWYFLQGYGGRTRQEVMNQNTIRLFCRKTDYDAFVLVSADELHKLKYEPEIAGFSIIPSYVSPYPVYTMALNTDNLQYYIDKYTIDAVCQSRVPQTTIRMRDGETQE